MDDCCTTETANATTSFGNVTSGFLSASPVSRVKRVVETIEYGDDGSVIKKVTETEYELEPPTAPAPLNPIVPNAPYTPPAPYGPYTPSVPAPWQPPKPPIIWCGDPLPSTTISISSSS